MRWHLFLLCMLAVAGCTTTPPRSAEVYEGAPTGPKTVIKLPSGGTLTHVARGGADPTSVKSPPAMGMESSCTYSTYELRDTAGHMLLITPSKLADPKRLDWTEDYQCIRVLASSTGDTIFINEDDTGPLLAQSFILLRKGADGKWSWSQFYPTLIDCYGSWNLGPNAFYYPTITGISDDRVWFQSPFYDSSKVSAGFRPGYKKKKWSTAIKNLKYKFN